MAEKRMFTQKIIDSDAFLDMPLSAQALYFHLNMRADDDGFVNNPKRVTKLVSASDDDLKILLMKRFIIGFESGVIVIKHWRMHNTLRQDRYHPTDYQEELAQLGVKPNKAYTDHPFDMLPASSSPTATTWQPDGNQVATEIREDKDSVDKDRLEKNREDLTNPDGFVCRTKDVRRIIEAWNSLGLQQVTKITGDSKRGGMLRARVKEYGVDAVLDAIEKVRASAFLQGQNSRNFVITFEWFVKPNNFPKVLEGNYDEHKGTRRKSKTAEFVSMGRDHTRTPDEMDKMLSALDKI